jgi:cation-dependent mannose-6-phosphate receptor
MTTVAPIVFDEGMSGGSVFTLLFFTALAIYFGGGILLRRFMRGAEGVEQIPHYAFWADLPNLIKEGIQFTLNGCEPVITYERI